jgi:hypothetical protein
LVLRKFILFFILITPALSLRAQDSYNYSVYGIGASVSQVYPFDDLKIANKSYSFSLSGYYNWTPYVNFAAELQVGSLSGGSIVLDESKRQYDNHYKALVFHGDIALGELIDYSESGFLGRIKDFYAGTGLGFISNNMAFIQRYNIDSGSGYAPGTYRFPGDNSSINIMIPVRFGYEFKIYNEYDEPYIGINIGYIHNVTFGENLDGYTDPPNHFKNNSPDQYRQIVIGIKYNFGPITSYTKKINRYYNSSWN